MLLEETSPLRMSLGAVTNPYKGEVLWSLFLFCDNKNKTDMLRKPPPRVAWNTIDEYFPHCLRLKNTNNIDTPATHKACCYLLR